MFSGIFGFGDWNAVIQGLPYQSAWRLGMTAGGAALYVLVVRLLAITIKPFVPDRSMYNTVGRVPYYAAGAFSCVAGLFDPLGIRLLIVSTIPAAFGGSSGLLWADSLVPRKPETEPLPLCAPGHRLVDGRAHHRRRVHRRPRSRNTTLTTAT